MLIKKEYLYLHQLIKTNIVMTVKEFDQWCIDNDVVYDNLVGFINETKMLLIERASWNDDDDCVVLRDIDIREIYREHINDEGFITSMADIYDDPDILFGHISKLEDVFITVRNLLWSLGILQKAYSEHKCLEMEDCYEYNVA